MLDEPENGKGIGLLYYMNNLFQKRCIAMRRSIRIYVGRPHRRARLPVRTALQRGLATRPVRNFTHFFITIIKRGKLSFTFMYVNKSQAYVFLMYAFTELYYF